MYESCLPKIKGPGPLKLGRQIHDHTEWSSLRTYRQIVSWILAGWVGSYLLRQEEAIRL